MCVLQTRLRDFALNGQLVIVLSVPTDGVAAPALT